MNGGVGSQQHYFTSVRGFGRQNCWERWWKFWCPLRYVSFEQSSPCQWRRRSVIRNLNQSTQRTYFKPP